MKKFFVILNLFFITMLAGCANTGMEDNPNTTANVKDNDEYNIYLITMDSTSYWNLIDEGCRNAVKEFGGINYKWIAPEKRLAPLQIECIDKAVKDGADAILISSLSVTEINSTLKKAAEAGVKIIYVDSAASYEAIATVMTDNELAGKIAGETMLQGLQEAGIQSGLIGVTAFGASAQNTMLRDKGFRSVFKNTDFTVSPTIYIGDNPDVIKNTLDNNSEYVGFFATNQNSTFNLGTYLKNSDYKMVFVGFDSDDFTLSLIDQNIMYATIVQNPQKMGHDSIAVALKILNGTFTDKNALIDTGVNAITKENLN